MIMKLKKQRPGHKRAAELAKKEFMGSVEIIYHYYVKIYLTVCDDGILIQLLCFWTLSIALPLFKTNSVSETGFCLRLQVEPTQLGPIDTARSHLRT
jgi:hypothetical protein